MLIRQMAVLRNHAPQVIAADFFTVVTARFDLPRVLILMEIGSLIRTFRLPTNATIEAEAILGGLYHEYRLRPAPS